LKCSSSVALQSKEIWWQAVWATPCPATRITSRLWFLCKLWLKNWTSLVSRSQWLMLTELTNPKAQWTITQGPRMLPRSKSCWTRESHPLKH
jgi:hypothetical protein